MVFRRVSPWMGNKLYVGNLPIRCATTIWNKRSAPLAAVTSG